MKRSPLSFSDVKPKPARRYPEHQQCRLFMQALREAEQYGLTKHLDFLLYYHVPNERSDAITARLLSAIGVIPGIPDYSFLWKVKGLSVQTGFIEQKITEKKNPTEDDKVKLLSAAQKVIRDQLIGIGINYAISLSAKESMDILFKWRVLQE